MSKSFDYSTASSLLRQAIELSSNEIPGQAYWAAATRTLQGHASRTYTPFVITALLARAIDGTIDPLSIKADSGNHAYSARTLAHAYVVPQLKAARIGIRTTGREPLNNQPFFRYDRVDLITRVRHPTEFAQFKTILGRISDLSSEQALHALSAVLRTRVQIELECVVTSPAVGSSACTNLTEFDTFVQEDSESGRRAQALAAAAMDLCFGDVRTSKVHDPSRHEPGDVAVFTGSNVLSLMEVRDKAVSSSDLQHFVDKCLDFGCRRVRMLAVSASQPPLDVADVNLDRAKGIPCQIDVTYSISELIRDCMLFSELDPASCLTVFAFRGSDRLRELEVKPTTLERWNLLVSAVDAEA